MDKIEIMQVNIKAALDHLAEARASLDAIHEILAIFALPPELFAGRPVGSTSAQSQFIKDRLAPPARPEVKPGDILIGSDRKAYILAADGVSLIPMEPEEQS